MGSGYLEGLYCKIYEKYYICLLAVASWTICLTSSAHNVYFSCPKICPKKIETFFHENVFMMGAGMLYLLCMYYSIPQNQIHHKYKKLHPDTYFVLYLHGCCFQLCKYWIPQGRLVRVNLCLSDHNA